MVMRWRQRVTFSGAIVIYSKIFSLGTACIPSSRSSVPSVLPVLDQARQERLDAGQRRFDILIDLDLLSVHRVLGFQHEGQAFHDRFMPAQAVFVIVRHASPPKYWDQ